MQQAIDSTAPLDRRLSVAPMMDWTDRHYRYFARLISRHTLLYTEMVTTGALIHGDRARFLRFDPAEHPLALQLGGSEPADLARCARWAQEWGYDEVNLNCGCPSDRVQNGRFGACLMAEAPRVRDCVAAMRDACDIDVTVKHRLGIDHMDSYDELRDFVGTVAAGGCEVFIVHARKAWLQGLSPRQNREVPPLNYPWVSQLKTDFPHCTIVINGGLETREQCREQLAELDGVMLGRAVYHDPWLLAAVDSELFGDVDPCASREALVETLLPYLQRELAAGTRLNAITRHLLGLYQRVPGARRFRRLLSENAHREAAGSDLLLAAVAEVTQRAA